MTFPRCPSCTRCLLHSQANTVCVPTVQRGTSPSSDRALLIIGEAPGANEDREGLPFVGRAGVYLNRLYIQFYKFPSLLDVYVSNVVRCRPPGNAKPNKTQIRRCSPYLLEDLKLLQSRYRQVILLCVGEVPVYFALGLPSVSAALNRQGALSDLAHIRRRHPKQWDTTTDLPSDCPTFSTYHPSYLMRNPSAALSVQNHLQLLHNYLTGKTTYALDPSTLTIEEAPRPAPTRRLVLDIETYGCLRSGPPQTQFHPLKSEVHDGVPPSRQIVTSHIAYQPSPDGPLHYGVFRMRNPQHRSRLWAWLRALRGSNGTLLNHNIAFDLLYLRHCYPECRPYLDHPLSLMDTIITNYLHDEGRPEKSLKPLSSLFSITQYKQGASGCAAAYASDRDPALWRYGCQDCGATWLLQDRLESAIRSFYGASTSKLSPFCLDWYSKLLWLIVWMSETGIPFNETRLRSLMDRKLQHRARLASIASTYSMTLTGKGSDTSKRETVQEAVEWLQSRNFPVPSLRLTPKTKAVGFDEENRNTLLDALRSRGGLRSAPGRKLKLLNRSQSLGTILDHFLFPLLVGRGKNHGDRSTVLIGGRAYPKWFPVPSQWADSSSGGTKQARITASGPPVQTFPPRLKKCILGWWMDYSQIELRIAALLSNDDAMMEEYQKSNPDLHARTAIALFGERATGPDARKLRQAGKTYNFRALYRGGAEIAQATLMKDVGIHLPISEIHRLDSRFWAAHRGLRKWQNELVDFVHRHGYYELPLIGQSRLFLGGKRAVNENVNDIVNLPVQAVAANVALSGQFDLWWAMRQAGLRTTIPLNVYDGLLVVGPPHERPFVRHLAARILPSPSYYQALCSHLGRTIPLTYD